MAKLGDICEVYSGYALKRFNDDCIGLPVIKIGNILLDGSLNLNDCQYTDEFVNEKYFSQRDDLYIALSGATTGKIGQMISTDTHVINQRVGVVRIKRSKAISKYIKYYLMNKTNQILQDAAGCAQPNISPKQIAQYEIPTIDESQMILISENLDKATHTIDLCNAILEKLDLLVKARFVEMFGDPVLNQKGFPVYRMDEVVEFQGGSQPDKKYFEYEPTPDNIRLIQIRDYKSDRYITYIPKSMAKRFCSADDIMIGRYGPPIFQILQGIEGSFNVALMKATPIMGNKEFIRYFLKQDCLLEYLEGMSKRTAGQDGIQMDKLKAYPFPFPPIELQEQFAAFIAQTDKTKAAVQQVLSKAETLKKALMQEYFG